MDKETNANFNEEITKQFITATENDPITDVIFIHSILHYAENLAGKSVLDLACGTGIFTRAAKEEGAFEVLGVDISQTMIDYCRSQEAKLRLGIQYHIGDGRTLGKVGDYDIVFANRIFYYMKNVEDLEKVVLVIYNNLKQGGKLIGFQLNSFSEKWYDKVKKFKRHVVKLEDISNGRVVQFSFTICGKKSLSTIQYHFDLATYQQVFNKIGFRNFTVYQPLVDQARSTKFPDINFEEYLETGSLVVLVAEK